MYARLLIMQLGPGMRHAATAMADEAFKLTRTLNGFVSANYLIFDEESGEYGSMTVWQSKADADAAAAHLTPWLEQYAAGKLKAPPVIRNAEVYQPG